MIHHHLNCQNRTFFNGDNLDVMRGINSQSIDLIATDPPFNKNRDFHATPDSLAKGASFQDRWSWEKDVHQDWVDQLHDDHPMLMEAIESAKHAHSEGMGAYMCFMSVRLLELHRVLKPTGSIYLHCDPTASHYLKAVMDAIFGHKNFKNEIIWCYSTSGRPKKFFAKKHDVILFYSKTNQVFWSNYKIPVSAKYLNSHYKQRDSEGKRCRIRIDHGKKRFYYPEDGVICNDWWDDIPYLNSQAKERTGYPTQKPLSLYQRIINASTRKDDIVLDPFAGCATTCMAAEALERHWIGIDIWKDAHLILTKRLQQNYDTCPIYVRTDIPTRTDHGRTAGPYYKSKRLYPRTTWDKNESR